MDCNFNGKRVLVVEDDYLIASQLAHALDKSNAVVVGPFSSLPEAQNQVIVSELAVLDINLKGQLAFDLADRLRFHDVPFVFYTGFEKVLLPERFSVIDVITKPVDPMHALSQLNARSQEIDAFRIEEIIPLLRLRAREFVSDAATADRLVEITLKSAIATKRPMPSGPDLVAWLLALMNREAADGRARFMN